MSLAGHCSGLYQTIRDEGTAEEGRGFLNFLGGLVDVRDDAANDETEVHIGKQPDLTDLFLTADVAPHLTLGIAGKTTRVRDNLRVDGQAIVGADEPVNSSIRAIVKTWGNLGSGASTMLQMSLTGEQSANAANRRGFEFVGIYELAGFNLTDFFGLQAVPILQDGFGGGVVTRYTAQRAGIDCRALATDAHAFEATGPGVDTQALASHGFRSRDMGVEGLVAYGFRCDEFDVAAATKRPFQDEGCAAETGDPHGNRFFSNVQIGSLTGAFAGGDGVLGMANARTAPSGTPAGGGVLWPQSGDLKWTDSGGNKQRVSPVQAAFTAANGNNNNCGVGEATFLRITGPSAAFTITGIAGGTPGRRLVIYNSTAQNMSITDEDAASTAANRISTMDGATHTTAGEGAALLEYDATAARWVLVHLEG